MKSFPLSVIDPKSNKLCDILMSSQGLMWERWGTGSIILLLFLLIQSVFPTLKLGYMCDNNDMTWMQFQREKLPINATTEPGNVNDCSIKWVNGPCCRVIVAIYFYLLAKNLMLVYLNIRLLRTASRLSNKGQF